MDFGLRLTLCPFHSQTPVGISLVKGSHHLDPSSHPTSGSEHHPFPTAHHLKISIRADVNLLEQWRKRWQEEDKKIKKQVRKVERSESHDLRGAQLLFQHSPLTIFQKQAHIQAMESYTQRTNEKHGEIQDTAFKGD